MNNFLNEFLYFAKNHIKENYPGTIIKIIDIINIAVIKCKDKR